MGKAKTISLILLAAGSSERFGKNKYLQPLNNIPLIMWSLKPYFELLNEFIKYKKNIEFNMTIVTGPFHDEIVEILNNKIEPFTGKLIKIIDFEKNNMLNDKFVIKENKTKEESEKQILYINVCKNHNHKKGMFSSYITAFNNILSNFNSKTEYRRKNTCLIISLADMPFISKDVIKKLLHRIKSKFSDFAVPYFVNYNEKGELIKAKKGHPIVLKSNFALKISKYSDNLILRDALKTGKIRLVKTDNKYICFDIDNINDYEIAKDLSVFK